MKKLAPFWKRKSSALKRDISFFRYLFPQIRRRIGARLDNFQDNTKFHVRHQIQSRILRYLNQRKLKKELRKTNSISVSLRGRLRSFLLGSARGDATRGVNPGMNSGYSSAGYRAAVQDGTSGETGGRRRKLAGYLRAANELRQTYQQSWNSKEDPYENTESIPGAFPGNAAAKSSEEEMVIFPSYAKRHIKQEVAYCYIQ